MTIIHLMTTCTEMSEGYKIVQKIKRFYKTFIKINV